MNNNLKIFMISFFMVANVYANSEQDMDNQVPVLQEKKSDFSFREVWTKSSFVVTQYVIPAVSTGYDALRKFTFSCCDKVYTYRENRRQEELKATIFDEICDAQRRYDLVVREKGEDSEEAKQGKKDLFDAVRRTQSRIFNTSQQDNNSRQNIADAIVKKQKKDKVQQVMNEENDKNGE